MVQLMERCSPATSRHVYDVTTAFAAENLGEGIWYSESQGDSLWAESQCGNSRLGK